MPKGKLKKVFPGGNTSQGFYSFYDYIIDQQEANRIFVIKGGPGVGKSTFMRKIGEAMLERGYDVEFHCCSSDNDSLDGIVIPAIKVALLDGTAPQSAVTTVQFEPIGNIFNFHNIQGLAHWIFLWKSPRLGQVAAADSSPRRVNPLNGGLFFFRRCYILRIAITGTHGTGKTTLAQTLSIRTGLPLIAEQARLVAAEMGLMKCNQLLRNPRLAKTFQWEILERQIAEQMKYPSGFIADRSALDSIAYWQLYLGNNQDFKNEASRYIFKARLHAWKNLDLLVYVPPVVLAGEDGFRLKDRHIEVDLFIRREVKLLQESGRVQVIVLKSETLDGRLAEIELALEKTKPPQRGLAYVK